jgi:type IV pilus assembly protein PilA
MKALKAGFTLIELMIVVAIIGLLAALAIPNFLKFQARARQSEGRSNLKAVFTAEKSYYGDQQTYYDEFSVIGFEPEMNNRYEYFIGGGGNETRPCALPPATANGASAICANGPQGTGSIENDEKWTSCAPAAPAYVAPGVSGTVIGLSGVAAVAAVGAFPAGTCCPQGLCEFAAGAAGNIDNDPSIDQWIITSQGSTAVGAAVSATNVCTGAAGTTGLFAEGEPVNVCNDVSF